MWCGEILKTAEMPFTILTCSFMFKFYEILLGSLKYQRATAV